MSVLAYLQTVEVSDFIFWPVYLVNWTLFEMSNFEDLYIQTFLAGEISVHAYLLIHPV